MACFLRFCIVLIASCALLVGCTTATRTSTGTTTTTSDGGSDSDAPDAIVTTTDTAKDTSGEIKKDVEPDVDVEPAKAGEFTASCNSNKDCKSGFCVRGKNGHVCTKQCLEDCPTGYECKDAKLSADVLFLCVPILTPLCEPCSDDSTCQKGLCRKMGLANFCTYPCGSDDSCPENFTCETLKNDDGAETKQCVPTNGTCDCTELNTGEKKLCRSTNDIGTCLGQATCDPKTGWVCNAAEPIKETCDGLDNDCNGLTDDLEEQVRDCSSDPVTIDNKEHTCKGKSTCQGQKGWVCNAKVPKKETCDNLDNDCDGEIDEDFKNSDGKLLTVEHCGQCGNKCNFPNANAKCAMSSDTVTYDVPTCLVDSCINSSDVFYEKLNDFQCIAPTTNICAKCKATAECNNGNGDGPRKCVNLGDETADYRCGNRCRGNDTCEDGFKCVELTSKEGAKFKQCIPESGSCGCTKDNVGLKETCLITVTTNGPEYKCNGIKTCNGSAFGECTFDVEDICNGKDDDCDGTTDNSYATLTNGTLVYDKTLTHCGQCNNSCPTYTPTQHANSECDKSDGTPQCKMVCEDKYFDVDENPTNGCECKRVGLEHADPLLDNGRPANIQDVVDGTDRNCDGIDGDINNSIFVNGSRGDDSSGTGSIDSPVQTICRALQLAIDNGKRDILVSSWIYEENIVLIKGIRIYGGYSDDFKIRIAKSSTIRGSVPNSAARCTLNIDGKQIKNLKGTVYAANVKRSNTNTADPIKAVLDGFTIIGYNNNKAGGNSYAVFLQDVDDSVQVSHNKIIAGNAGRGDRGPGGVDGLPGVKGSDGKDSCDISSNAPSSRKCPTKTSSLQGGNGGTQSCKWTADDGTPGLGGKGGTSREPVYNILPTSTQRGDDGTRANDSNCSGLCATGRNGGWDSELDTYGNDSCGICSQPTGTSIDGFNGDEGRKGNDGIRGDGCTDELGFLLNGEWIAANGASGKLGNHGYGGGGGGSGGGTINTNTECSYVINGTTVTDGDDIGASGGGGGTGGCRGKNGRGGNSGGGSFGIFVANASQLTVPLLVDNDLRRGFGGNGGNGGNGGTGGTPGVGGTGGKSGQSISGGYNAVFCSGRGGNGGTGGRGGHGGGGGGGCGGVSVAIYLWNVKDTTALTGNTFDSSQLNGIGGLKGLGGYSPGKPGTDGKNGKSCNIYNNLTKTCSN